MFCGSSWILMAFVLTLTTTVISNHQQGHHTLADTDICIGKETCHECIQTPQCAWCSAPGFGGLRCFSPHRLDPTTYTECSEEFINNPDNNLIILRRDELTSNASSLEVTGQVDPRNHPYADFWYSTHASSFRSSAASDRDHSRPSSDRSHKTVQFSPQELELDLRVRQAYNVSFSYARATEFPVDVYYLMNFRQPIENGSYNYYFTESAEVLAESLRNVTSNLRLGFGGTVTHSRGEGNEKIYGFDNVMPLSQDIRTFADGVRNFSVSSNLEAWEGGPDAIVQAIVCRKQIGWRSDSLKLLVFLTDTEFPQDNNNTTEATGQNDGLCHFDARGFSMYSSSQGHTTISQINQIVDQNRINIIWAVTNEEYDKFSRFPTYVAGSFALKFTSNSTAVADLIRKQYEAISSSVEIKDTAKDNVKVRYFSTCLDDEAANETSKCNGLKFGTKVEFLAEIEATSCPMNKTEWKQKIEIYPVGINESLAVTVRIICDCHCEQPGHSLYEAQSASCSRVGTLACGVCECGKHNYGKHCECTSSEFDQLPSLRSRYHPCRPDNTSSVDCSGRGSCVCGQCECDRRQSAEEVISGRFCECDNFSCDRLNGKICSDHGNCNCGQCMCDLGWSGSACECSTSGSPCIPYTEDANVAI